MAPDIESRLCAMEARIEALERDAQRRPYMVGDLPVTLLPEPTRLDELPSVERSDDR